MKSCKKYKYLYKIEYLNAKDGQPKYYIGSRVSKLKPNKDFFIKYFTSSKIIHKIIEEEGLQVFNILWIKELEITSSNNFISFSQKFNRDENITWFTLSYDDSESGNILIKTYKNEHKSIYNTERVIDCEYNISINELDDILAKFINSMQDKYNIILSKDSKNEFTKATLSDIKKYLFEK